jgi:putative transposase
VDEDLAARIQAILKENAPVALGFRRVWAILRFQMNLLVSRKKVQRIMQIKGWQAKPLRRPHRPAQEPIDPRRAIVDPTEKVAVGAPNERWCIDLTKFFVEGTGWVCLIPVLCCFSRKALGWYLGVRGRSIEAFEAVRDAAVREFGSLDRLPQGITLRQDNGSIFLAHHFLDAMKRLNVDTEYTPFRCPSANGIAERFMRTVKEECVWHHRFQSIEEARAVIGAWIHRYNTQRRHSSLGYRTPQEHIARYETNAA